MRIIDKNQDFYDSCQYIYPDDSITFDRTDSFLVTKDLIRNACGHWGERFILLQVGYTFWLFFIEWKNKKTGEKASYSDWAVDIVGEWKDYDLILVSSWKNFNHERKLLDLSIIRLAHVPYNMYSDFNFKTLSRDYKMDKIRLHADALVDAINHNDIRVIRSFNKEVFHVDLGRGKGYKTIEKHIPILRETGVANVIDPMSLYMAIEEFFSHEKTASERTESIGLTDKEKIENHGFSAKTSFRGK